MIEKKHTFTSKRWKQFEVKIQKEKMKGVTLVDALEKVICQQKEPSSEPLRIEQDKIVLRVDVRFYPSGVKGKGI